MSTESPDEELRIAITLDEIDHGNVDDFAEQLRVGLRDYEGSPHARPGLSFRPLVIDLRDVSFLNSAGLRALIDADRAAGAHGGRIVVDGAHGVVRRCLEVTGLLEHFALPDGHPDGDGNEP